MRRKALNLISYSDKQTLILKYLKWLKNGEEISQPLPKLQF